MKRTLATAALVALTACATESRCPNVATDAPAPCIAVAPQPTTTQLVAVQERSVGPLEEAYTKRAALIRERSTKRRDAYERLRVLTDDIGHRLSGTPALERAVAWAKAELEKDGQENVRAEEVLVPHWKRGKESGRLGGKAPRDVKVLGLGGTIPTPKGGVTAPVLVVGSFDELEARAAEVRGKIVLFNVAMPPFDEEKGSGYGEVVPYRSEGPSRASKLGAKAVLMRSVTARSLSTLHTGALRYAKDVDPIPAAAITTEDADLLARLAAHGEPPPFTLELASQTAANAKSHNVVAELTGSERPDELVLIGAHLDSWDVGQGAHDDGAGCVMVIQALADLRALGLRPRRTIRAVLFTNEENGLEGAKAYAKAHAGEVPNVVAAFEADLGGFAPKGLNVEVAEPKRAAVVARVEDLMRLLEPLGATRVTPGFSGADLIPLVKSGVLGLGLVTDHRSYFDIHHTEADTLDKVDPDDLAKNVAFVATMAFVLADAPERIDRDGPR